MGGTGCRAPSGLIPFSTVTQGVALGWRVCAPLVLRSVRCEGCIAGSSPTTMASASALPAASRMMCSSCGRFTGLEFANDGEALRFGEYPAERTRLAKARGALVGRFHEREQLIEGAGDKELPFEQSGPGSGGTGFQPADDVCARFVHECGLASQFSPR